MPLLNVTWISAVRGQPNILKKTYEPVPILVVDDERDHALFIQDILRETDIPLHVQTVESGEEAVAYLSGEGRFADRSAHPFPLLILLDLRMPGMGGFGVLRWLCSHPELKQGLNIVALSSIQSSKEIEVVYELGAQYFWAKSDSAALQDRVRRVHKSWVEGIEQAPDSSDLARSHRQDPLQVAGGAGQVNRN